MSGQIRSAPKRIAPAIETMGNQMMQIFIYGSAPKRIAPAIETSMTGTFLPIAWGLLCSAPKRIAPAIETSMTLINATLSMVQPPKESPLRLKPSPTGEHEPATDKFSPQKNRPCD